MAWLPWLNAARSVTLSRSSLDAPKVKLEWKRNGIQRVASVLAASLVLPLDGASHRRKLLLGSMAGVRHLLHRFE